MSRPKKIELRVPLVEGTVRVRMSGIRNTPGEATFA